MADFVGLPVDEVEEIYQKLLDVGAVDEVRTRTEVALNAQGRNMASEAMSENPGWGERSEAHLIIERRPKGAVR